MMDLTRFPNGQKWLSAERLAELMVQLPAGSSVVPNAVGNLSILNQDMEYIGYVDFVGEGAIEINAQPAALRRTNNELKALPGFFFVPWDKNGLVELTQEERITLLTNQGNYAVNPHVAMSGPEKIDLACALDNARIPTHRKSDAVAPEYGSVPINLVEVIYYD